MDSRNVPSPDALVFFGHQSVGDNILEGVSDMGLMPLSTLSRFDDSLPEVGIVHAQIGRNGYPAEKIDDFRKTLLEWSVERLPEIAVMKFCYVDINAGTDIEALFDTYVDAVEEIADKLPEVSILHTTVPLVNADSRLKATLKKALGRAPYAYADNLARERYNQMIRDAFNDALFDIAEVESTRPDGVRVSFHYDGLLGYSLYREYASDSAGHLNKQGRERLAQEFLGAISRLSE